MRNLAKFMSISLLALGLAACDGDTKDSSKTANASATSSAVASTVGADQKVTLLAGKLSFTLLPGMVDETGSLGNKANNLHAYSDSGGKKTVIVIIDDNIDESLEALTQRMEENQRARDANVQVISNKAITLDNQPMRQFDSVTQIAGAKNYSSAVVAKIGTQRMTLQITLPADDQLQAQGIAESIINTLKIAP